MALQTTDKNAPMASAPMKFNEDGSVDWGNMWDSFCALAQEGGPPHRSTMLYAPQSPDCQSEGYQFAVKEIVRGIQEVSGLQARPVKPGWLAVACPTPEMARWLSEAVREEKVEAHADGNDLLVPVGETFTLKGEIKNVITAVAKTTHYWQEHLPVEVKRTLRLQMKLSSFSERCQRWIRALTAR